MKYFPFSLAVGVSVPLQVEGTYMRYYSVSVGGGFPTLEIKTEDGAAFLLKPGQSIRFPKRKKVWSLNNFDASNTITGILVVGDGEIIDNRISGDVSINSVASITGTVGVSGTVITQEQGYLYGASYASSANIAAGGTSEVFSAASNVAGAIVHAACAFSVSAGATALALIAKATAPTTSIDGDLIASAFAGAAGASVQLQHLSGPVKIAAGKGLFFHNVVLETGATRGLLYTLLA